ncbi:SDR family oxidoreductase [Streptosporangium sp. 'caverna']|uniref:SDR family oxidoreductase n=1 Tax=Streptosporangium sp. 'caverna' TaxID=2202249 RepID=UPI000D7DF02F|nr:SDR family oxidoreductase [Streptosporangium sp. 'caverna']AWS43747.1 short-chain dehydrogenase/reductase [Streptosporangium sp. 'caverna']
MTRTILITGSSSGIGRATAKHFHEQGWNVIATMRNPEHETELTALENLLVTRLDVQDSHSITAAVDAGLERFGRIDVLLNNAGYGAYGLLEATPMDKIRRQFDVNVMGLLETTKAVLPHLRANGSGTIVNISSIGGKVTFPLGTLYHGTKFAVEGLSEALHYELAAIGVNVKIVEPGLVNTDFAGRSLDFTNDENLTEYQKLVGAFFTAQGQMGAGGDEPEVVAETVYRAATDGTDRLRYAAGPYAADLIANRAATDDATFIGGIKLQFGL